MKPEEPEENSRESALPALPSSSPPPAKPSRTVLGAGLWVLLVLVAAIEVAAHFTIVSRVPPDSDWHDAAAYVRENLTPRDTVVAAPAWADPILRRELGDRMSFAMAGMSDLAGFERLWALSIRGHLPAWAPPRAPDFERRFGRVRALRWDLGPSPVLYDFADHVYETRVEFEEHGRTRVCRKTHGRASPGGLSQGPSVPHERFVCDPQRPWFWAGETVMEDLSLEPRRCVYEHPLGPNPVRMIFHDVPLGDNLVVYAGVYSEHERMEQYADIRLRMIADGREIATLLHRDGEGWKRLMVQTESGVARELVVEVTGENQHWRTFCWSATTRHGQRPESQRAPEFSEEGLL